MKRILVVEDDGNLREGICYALEKDGYRTAAAGCLAEAERLCRTEEKEGNKGNEGSEEGMGSICLILLDVNLPDGDGFSFCSRIRESLPSVPVLFLTARDLEEDALRGYELGAEDYITKPFSMKILLKKIALILRRSGKEESSVFDDGYLTVDFERTKITAGGEACRLTPTEFRLLRQFILHPRQLLTYEVLLDRLWDEGGQFVEKHTLAVNVNRLRGKIEQDGRRYISNIYGMGYQWLG